MDLRLVILPNSASVQPMLQLLRALIRQGLFDPSVRFLQSETEVLELGMLEADDQVLTLEGVVGSSKSNRILVVNLVTADGLDSPSTSRAEGAVPPELELLFSVTGFIRNAVALDLEGETRVQRLDVVNLVAPAAAPSSLPSNLFSQGVQQQGREGQWWNVVIAPEVQETSPQAAVPVTSDERYIANATASLITLLGAWSGAPGETPAWGLPNVVPDVWTIVRTRSRSIVAPELPTRVLGRVTRSTGGLPVDDHREFALAPHPSVATDLGLTSLIEDYRLTLQPTPDIRQPVPDQEQISIRQYFQILWAWLVGRLPEIVEGNVTERIRSFGDSVDRRLNRRLLGGGAQSQYRIRLFGRDKQTTEHAELVQEADDGPRWGFTKAEPGVWRALRSLSFGLLDGGNTGFAKVEALLGEGKQRYVLGDRTYIAPPPDVALFEPSTLTRSLVQGPAPSHHVVDPAWTTEWENAIGSAITAIESEASTDAASFESNAAGIERPAADPSDKPEVTPNDGSGVTSAPPDNDDEGTIEVDNRLRVLKGDQQRLSEAVAAGRRSLLWQLYDHLLSQRGRAEQTLEDLQDQLVKAKDEQIDQPEAEKQRKKKGRGLVRRLVVKLAILLGLLGAFLAVFAFHVVAIAVAPVVLAFVVAVGSIVWLASLFRVLWRTAFGYFLLDNELFWLREGQVRILDEAIEFAEGQLHRFEYLTIVDQEWTDLIAEICYHPFRSSKVADVRRTREAELGLPLSHRVIEGFTTEPRLDGITSSVAAHVIGPGWLQRSYDSCQAFCIEEHGLRVGRGHFDPDADSVIDPRQFGPRRRLVDGVLFGKARSRQELELLNLIHARIRQIDLNDPSPTSAPRTDEVVDFLFSRDGDVSPSEFLNQSTVGAPTAFNRGFISFGVDYQPDRLTWNVTGLVALPEIPSVEALIEGSADIDYPPLIFTSWSIESVDQVPVDSQKYFSDEWRPAEIDLDRANSIWVEPVGDCIGVIEPRDPADRGTWKLISSTEPGVGDRVTPRGAILAIGRGGPHSFVSEVDGEPLAHPYDKPIPYALRLDCSPPGAVEMVLQALQLVADRTGYEFVYDGNFEGLPEKGNGRIEIGWAFDDEFRAWEVAHGKEPGKAIGFGGPDVRYDETSTVGWVLSGGLVLLNADMGYEVAFRVGPCHGKILLHEIGHAMNLGHVNDPIEVMMSGNFPPRPELDFGPGDTAGLRYLAALGGRRG